MGYRIVYGPEKKTQHACWEISRLSALSCLFFLFFLIAVGFFWEEGEVALRQMLTLPNLEGLGQVEETFIQQLWDREAVQAAFADLWQQIRGLGTIDVY